MSRVPSRRSFLTALGTQTQIRAAADELDRHDPSPADAVSWFEEKPGKFRLEVYVPTKQDAASVEAIVGAAGISATCVFAGAAS